MGVLGNVFRAVASGVQRAASAAASGVRRAASAAAKFAKVASRWAAKTARKGVTLARVWAKAAVVKVRAAAAHLQAWRASSAPRQAPMRSSRPMAMSGARGGSQASERPSGGSSRQSGGMVCPNGHRVSPQTVPCRCGGHSQFSCNMRMGIRACGWKAVIPPMGKDCDS